MLTALFKYICIVFVFRIVGLVSNVLFDIQSCFTSITLYFESSSHTNLEYIDTFQKSDIEKLWDWVAVKAVGAAFQ